MLKKRFKLNLRKEKNFFQTCKKKHSSYFSLFYRKNSQKGLRIVVIIPKKRVSLSTKRNELKRVVYSKIAHIIKTEKIDNRRNIDVVVVINKKNLSKKDDFFLKKIEDSLIEIKV